MAAAATLYRIQVELQGLNEVAGLKSAIRQLTNVTTPAAADLQKLRNAAAALGSATDRTESDLRTTVSVLKDVRANVALNSAEFRKLTNEIGQYEKQLNRANGTGGRFRKVGQSLGAVAASGVFGGPEGAIGAGIGAAFGPAAALAGGAIGAQVGMVRQQLGGTATYSADLEKQRIALKLIIKDTTEYNSALSFLAQTSKEYAIPQDRLIKGFTQVSASVIGAGGNIQDAKTAFEGITAGIRGTGRSLDDLDGALLATAQVFSKGKVSAEELRGQIGERLPGAYNLFAQAIGKTPQELDKALERGEVSLADFLQFSKKVFGEYGENAKIIADSPEAAGDRLQTSLKNLSENVGRLLRPIGAAFQTTFASIIEKINQAAASLANFLGMNKTNAQRIGQLNNLIITQQKGIATEELLVSQGSKSKKEAQYTIDEFKTRIAELQAKAKALKALEGASQGLEKPRPSLADSVATPAAGSTDDGSKKIRDAAKAAADAAMQQQRLNEERAKAQIELDDRRFQHAQENARRLYEFQLELDRKQRDNWVKMQTGAARTAAGLASSYFAQLEDLQAKRFDAQQKVEAAQQKQRSQTQIAAVTAAGTDIAAPSSSNAVSRLFEAANSKLGLFAGQTERCADAIRELFKVAGIAIGTTKKAWDGLGSGPSLASSFFGSDIGQRINKKEDLRKGDLVGFDRTYGSWGKGVQTHVGMYAGDGMMYDHSSRRGLTKRPLDTFAGKFLYGVRPNALAGGTPSQNALQRRSVATAGEAQERGLDVAQEEANKKATELENAAKQLNANIAFVLDYTESLRTQNAELKNSAQLTMQRNRLELEGVRPELIDAEDKKLAKMLEVKQANQGLADSLAEAKIKFKEGSVEYKDASTVFSEATARNNGYLQEFAALTDQAAAAQIAYNDALAKVNIAREGAKTISDGFKGFLKTAITGGDIQDAAKQMATSIRDKFLDMALDAAFKPFEEMLFKGFKDAMGLNKPADAATQAANTQLDAAGKMNAAADKMLGAASGTAADMSSLALPGFPDGVPSYAQGLATPTNFAVSTGSSPFGALGFDPSAAFGVATEAGTAFADSMSNVNDSLTKAPTAAQEANKGMQNFLGGMAGVAAGAMSIASGIQQIGEGGTSNVLGGIGSVLLGLGGAFGGLNGMGLFGKRAAGGPVAAQRPYMVGERGPELFMPGTSGSIGATSALRDAMASGGGGSGSPVLNMSFQSTTIGGTEYVDRAQLEQAMAETRRSASRDGARRGMSMTLDKLQQSPATRSRVGMR